MALALMFLLKLLCARLCLAEFNASITLEELQARAGTTRPGANSVCKAWRDVQRNEGDKTNGSSQSRSPSNRLRRDWLHMPWKEKQLYLDALELALERGMYQRFLRYHLDEKLAVLSHGTCAFALWHRRFVLAVENMLRSLGPPEFACLTLPYWNIMSDYEYQKRNRLDEGWCTDYETCSPILTDIGGRSPGGAVIRSVAGFARRGVLVNGRPFQNVTDDFNQSGIVRADLRRTLIPSDCDMRVVSKQIIENSNYFAFATAIEENIHDHVHNTVGGYMPTNASPVDLIFLNWHSTIDLIHYAWQVCHHTKPVASFSFDVDAASCARTEAGKIEFPSVSSSDRIYMSYNGSDISEDPIIGHYFADDSMMIYRNVADARALGEEDSFDYEMPLAFRDMLERCPSSGYQSEPVAAETPYIPASRIERWKAMPSGRTVEDWLYVVRRRVDHNYTNEAEADRRLAYFRCIIDSNNSLLNDEFVDNFVNEEVHVERCLDALKPLALQEQLQKRLKNSSSSDTWKESAISFAVTLLVLLPILACWHRMSDKIEWQSIDSDPEEDLDLEEAT